MVVANGIVESIERVPPLVARVVAEMTSVATADARVDDSGVNLVELQCLGESSSVNSFYCAT
jgi:hypothetical protein